MCVLPLRVQLIYELYSWYCSSREMCVSPSSIQLIYELYSWYSSSGEMCVSPSRFQMIYELYNWYSSSGDMWKILYPCKNYIYIYSKIWPEPLGFPSGSGHILPYIPPWVIIQILSHSSQGFCSISSCSSSSCSSRIAVAAVAVAT